MLSLNWSFWIELLRIILLYFQGTYALIFMCVCCWLPVKTWNLLAFKSLQCK